MKEVRKCIDEMIFGFQSMKLRKLPIRKKKKKKRKRKRKKKKKEGGFQRILLLQRNAWLEQMPHFLSIVQSKIEKE